MSGGIVGGILEVFFGQILGVICREIPEEITKEVSEAWASEYIPGRILE